MNGGYNGKAARDMDYARAKRVPWYVLPERTEERIRSIAPMQIDGDRSALTAE